MNLLAAAITNEPHTVWEWCLALFNIIWIDIVLAGDNAVVIALAVRGLPDNQRKKGIILGAGAAVLLRAVLTAVATQLLTIPYLKLIGGLLILWIAIKLLTQHSDVQADDKPRASGLWQAVWMIVVADITMSLDNVMAVGGAARGNNTLIWIGLALSIPLVVFGSNIISRMMARYPIIVFIGAAILGKVGGEMIMTDAFVAAHVAPWWAGLVNAADSAVAYKYLRYVVEFALAGGIFVFGWMRRKKE